MSLKKINRIRKTVGFRLAFWFCAIFILSSLLLFSIGYFFLSSSLKRRDQDSIQLKLEELSALYQSGGIDQLKREISIDKKFVEKNPFLIRLADQHNRTLVLILPYQWLESNLKRLEDKDFSENLKRIRLPIKDNRYELEVRSVLLKKSYILQVGKSNEEREKILVHFREIFSFVMIPLILLGFAGGIFVAHRSLLPVRNLIATLRAIESGKMNARVAGRQTDDELDELIMLFNKMLERIESLIRGMRDALDNIAHDLRTPMTRFRGIAERALQPDQDGESCEEALGTCLEESDQILKMLNTLMDISEAETGTIKLDLEVVNVSILIDRVLDLYRYTAEEKGIHINFSVQDDLRIGIDQAKMGQALSNLIDNAIKYTPDNGYIDIDAFEEDNRVIIRIRDRGMGIPEEELPRIWDRLFRGKQARTQRGLGLGLNLVKAIVHAHKGILNVSSEPGKGSTFSIILPSKIRSII
jgi:signal transduction histidine kinase